MIVVTGAAGFIGSVVLAYLNKAGREDIIIVDHLDDEMKKANLDGKKYAEYCDKVDFIQNVKDQKVSDVDCIIHMGACSSTTLTDAEYYKENNYEYTLTLAKWAVEKNIRFIYASSAATYGDGANGYKDDISTIRKCKPLNLYGQSKQDFDEWVLDHDVLDKVVGLKFFNVFGPNEYHKGDMRSVVCKAYERVVSEGKIFLFKSYRDDYKDGEQKRDFIYVKDAAEVVMYFFNNPGVNGIFNVGTGKARTWNDLANSLFAAAGKEPDIEYVDMPDGIKDQYQYFTEADMENLRKAGYTKLFTGLEDAVSDYAGFLRNHSCI